LIITDPGSILGTTFFSWDFTRLKHLERFQLSLGVLTVKTN
jgi:hypothetical protein